MPIVAIIARKHPIFKNKKSYMKKLISFIHFSNISTVSECPAIKFFKTGLIYSYIFPLKFKNQQNVQFVLY